MEEVPHLLLFLIHDWTRALGPTDKESTVPRDNLSTDKNTIWYLPYKSTSELLDERKAGMAWTRWAEKAHIAEVKFKIGSNLNKPTNQQTTQDWSHTIVLE